MIQDIAPKTFHNEFTPKAPKDTDLVFIFQKGKPLFYLDGTEKKIPTYAIIKELFPNSIKRMVYLCSVDEVTGFFIGNSERIEVENNCKLTELSNCALEDVRIFRTYVPSWQSYMGITASHLYKWYKYHKYCGHCAGEMEHSKKERAMICTKCGFTDYPKICPVIIVAIKNGDKLLLTKYANRGFTRYALVAGFCEIGETVEETVHREVMEEVGIKVKNLTYYKSQPWGFSESLIMGFFAELDGDADITLDRDELAEAVWMDRKDIPTDTENGLSITYTMMQAFKNGDVI
ncbi:NAD(+) diphosphatase [Chakrabartyella piscis]|uniref:NAD(+) diphosphatase n=1 Tax=Chakrabartyella piscis TaxID=2918914 RepID=UPI0029587B3A|nr:NAD(+) diphosphatase [Chakrabartyella piscis]